VRSPDEIETSGRGVALDTRPSQSVQNISAIRSAPVGQAPLTNTASPLPHSAASAVRIVAASVQRRDPVTSTRREVSSESRDKPMRVIAELAGMSNLHPAPRRARTA
jgi:hypothetical protein